MKTTPVTAPSTKRSLPQRIRRDADPHRIEPLEARIAPAAHVFGPDAFGYLGSDSLAPGAGNSEFIDISATGTKLAKGGLAVAPLTGGNLDDGFWQVPLGINFAFYGQAAPANLIVSTNGFATFNSAGATNFVNSIGSNGTPADPNAGLFAFWDDLLFNSTTPGLVAGTDIDSGLYYQVIGSGADRRMIVQWNEVPFLGGTVAEGHVTFQMQLFEGEGRAGEVRFEYAAPATASARAAGSSASIGIENFTGSTAAVFSEDQASLSDLSPEVPTGDRVRFVTFRGPSIDLGVETDFVINANGAANSISYEQSDLNPAWGKVTVDGEVFHFANKTNLIINGLGGDDVISVNNASTPTGLTGITVNGGDPTASDTLVVSGTTGLDTINFTPSSSSAGTAQVNALPLITLAGIEHLAIDGQGGGDNLQVNGTAGNEFIFHTPLGVQTGSIQVSALLSATYTNVGSVTPNGNGGAFDTLVVNGRSGDDNFVVLSPSGNIGLTDQTQLRPLAISSLQLKGLEGDDLFTLNRPNPYTSIDVDGGSGGNDRLTILGESGAADTYIFDPSTTVGIGTVTANGVDTDYQGIDRVNIFGNNEAGDTLEVRDASSDSLWDVRQGQGGDDLVQIDQREPLAYRSMGSVTLVNRGGNDLFRIAPTSLGNFSGTFTVNGLSTRDVLELDGTANNDAVTSAAAAITVNGVTVTLGNVSFASTQVLGLGGDDSVNLSAFTSTPTVIRGDDGNDTLIGSPQADVIFGGTGNDILVGGAGVDQEYGEDGNDIFGNATLTSNGVADDAGGDFAFGGPGFDNFVWEPGDGADFNNGGEDGADIFRFFGDANANVFTLRPGGTPTHFNALIGAVNIDNHGVEDVVVDGQGGADSFTVNDLFTTEVVSVNLVLGSADAAVDTVTVNGRALSDHLLITTPAAAAVRVSGLRYNVNLTTVEPTDTLTLNGNEGDDELKAVDGIEALIAITLDGGQGNDTLSADALLLGGIGNDILTGGLGNDSFDGGAGTDRVVAAGDVNFTLTNTTLTGLGTDSLTAIEEVQLTGGASANTFNVGAYTGRLFLTGDDGADTIDFSTATGSVIFDLDLVGLSQAVTGAGLKVTLGDVIENFTGSAFNDLLFADAAIFARVLNGGLHTVVPPGDKLSFDGRGQIVTVVPVDANTGTIKTKTLADTAYDEFESLVITNSPSGGGFGPPGSNSNAFTDAHIYDPTTFTIAGKPAAGRGPNSVATGDLNGDGFADMISANGKTKNISVFLNKGDGTFGEPTNFISASGPQDLVVGFFDADANLDVAVTNRLAGNVSIFLGNGAGGFLGAPALIKTPGAPHAIASGDLNGDTFADLVVTLPGISSVTVLSGNGAGGFAVGPKVKVLGVQPVDVVVGDFNNDADLDVATANYASANISFLQGNGAGGFAPATRFATGLRPTSLAIGDINNDGNPDLAVSHLVSRFVSVLFGNGAVAPATQFAPQLRVALPGNHAANSIAIADFNGDGLADLGLGNSISTSFTILLGAGLGKFTQPYEFDLGRFPKAPKTNGIAIADLNNDGLLDVIATSPNTDDLRVLLRNV